jgi:hypothetical protein
MLSFFLTVDGQSLTSINLMKNKGGRSRKEEKRTFSKERGVTIY